MLLVTDRLSLFPSLPCNTMPQGGLFFLQSSLFSVYCLSHFKPPWGRLGLKVNQERSLNLNVFAGDVSMLSVDSVLRIVFLNPWIVASSIVYVLFCYFQVLQFHIFMLLFCVILLMLSLVHSSDVFFCISIVNDFKFYSPLLIFLRLLYLTYNCMFIKLDLINIIIIINRNQT